MGNRARWWVLWEIGGCVVQKVQMNQEDVPLNEAFYENPLDYMQNYVRNLNNEIFLSEYHINNLYALLLIGRNSPWDAVKGNHLNSKAQIDEMVHQKVNDVKTILESLSNMYEDKVKKTAITQIEKLMGILKAKKKAIFIEKARTAPSLRNVQLMQHFVRQGTQPHPPEHAEIKEERHETGEEKVEKSQPEHTHNEGEAVKEREPDDEIPSQEVQESKCHKCSHHAQPSQGEIQEQQGEQVESGGVFPKLEEGKQVFGIFYGLANLSNLSSMALTNMLEYNSSERFIKFKMSHHYIMTIKNEDPLYFDRFSQFRKVPSDLFVQHVFPYLTASELFGMRGICKEWLEHVKESWHATFKREMFVQLLACEFCKDIEFFYKTIQLRNPFFQKLSLLIHALIEIIQWDNVYNAINTNTLSLQLKRILMIVLRLIGEPIPLVTLAAINDAFFDQHKHRLVGLKEKVTQFFSTLSGSDLSINELRVIKTQFLDDPFMRVEELNSEDKSPLLLTLFVKQMTLQQILRNHIFLAQEYLLNTKKRLDNISQKMVYQKGYLEGVYKILLLKSTSEPLQMDNQPAEMPNFAEMMQSIFLNKNSDKPDFVIRNKHSSTEIFLDNATKLDIILSTVYNIKKDRPEEAEAEKTEQIQQECVEEEGSERGRKQEVSRAVADRSEEIEEKAAKNQINTEVDLKIECSSEKQSSHTQPQQ